MRLSQAGGICGRWRHWLIIAIAAAGFIGCASTPATTTPAAETGSLRVTHHLGGTHHRAIIHDGLWYQTHGTSLLVLDPVDASVVSEVELAPIGRSGPAVDILVSDHRLLVVLEDDALIELSLNDPASPRIIRRLDAETLGIRPRRIMEAGAELYVAGLGGVTRLSDRETVYRTDFEVASVVLNRLRLVVTIGRRAYQLPDEQFLGAASELIPLPATTSLPGSFVFVRRNETGAAVGLMTDAMREVDAHLMTVQINRSVHRVDVTDDRIWIVAEDRIYGYVMHNGQLKPAVILEVTGGRDLAVIDDNYLALCGTFGRAIYRRWEDETGPGESLIHLHAEPGGITQAAYDGRQVVASSGESAWRYVAGESLEQVDLINHQVSNPSQAEAITIWAAAHINDNGRGLVIVCDGREWEYHEPDHELITTVVAVDGRFWLGHERGITVLASRPPEPITVVDRLRLDGPVRWLFPLPAGGGAVYVSESGGLGVAATR